MVWRRLCVVTPFLCAFVTALSFFYIRLSSEEGKINAATNAFVHSMPALAKPVPSQRGYPTLRRIRGESESSEGTNKKMSRESAGEEMSKTEGLLFIHIPKAAGFTWRRILHQIADGWVLTQDTRHPNSTLAVSDKIDEDEERREEIREGERSDLLMDKESMKRTKMCAMYCKCVEGLSVVSLPKAEVPSSCAFMLGHVDFSAADYFQEKAGTQPVDKLYVVTNLREPVSRIVSEYYYLSKMRFRHPAIKANLTLREYATSYLPMNRLTNLMTKMLAGVTYQSSYYPQEKQQAIVATSTTLLEEAKRNLREKVFFFGLNERFLESLKLFMMQFNVSKKLAVLSTHGTPDGYETLDDEELAREIREMNHLDVSLYHYAERLFEERVAEHLGGLGVDKIPPRFEISALPLDLNNPIVTIANSTYVIQRVR